MHAACWLLDDGRWALIGDRFSAFALAPWRYRPRHAAPSFAPRALEAALVARAPVVVVARSGSARVARRRSGIGARESAIGFREILPCPDPARSHPAPAPRDATRRRRPRAFHVEHVRRRRASASSGWANNNGAGKCQPHCSASHHHTGLALAALSRERNLALHWQSSQLQHPH